jgi:hypothetical protein
MASDSEIEEVEARPFGRPPRATDVLQLFDVIQYSKSQQTYDVKCNYCSREIIIVNDSSK